MAQKKMDDVKRPEKVTPGSSGRPIVVTNRPVLANDPMMVSTVDATEASDATTVTVRTSGKVIQPVSKDLQSAPPQPETPAAAEPAEDPVAADTTAAEAPETPPTESPVPPTEEDTVEPTQRDADAAAVAAETEVDAAKLARDAELQQLIASGKYVVPINAVGRKRSRGRITLFCLLGLVLALLLVDFLFDTGIVHVPVAVPHTHLFTVQ